MAGVNNKLMRRRRDRDTQQRTKTPTQCNDIYETDIHTDSERDIAAAYAYVGRSGGTQSVRKKRCLAAVRVDVLWRQPLLTQWRRSLHTPVRSVEPQIHRTSRRKLVSNCNVSGHDNFAVQWPLKTHCCWYTIRPNAVKNIYSCNIFASWIFSINSESLQLLHKNCSMLHAINCTWNYGIMYRLYLSP